MYFIGIDISSTSTKVAILDNQDNFCDLFLLSSSFSTIKIVRDIKEILEQKSYQEMPQSQLLDMEEQV
ncbi:CoA protein activase [Campylobacter concisus]|jgi:(R)-2-hydroxyglutaryl-CoA dehydratase activator